MKRQKKMVWAIDQNEPEKAPFKIPEDRLIWLNDQRRQRNYKGDKPYVVIDDPDLPEILIAGAGRGYDLKEVRRLKELEAATPIEAIKPKVEKIIVEEPIIEVTEKVIEEKPKVKKTYKKRK